VTGSAWWSRENILESAAETELQDVAELIVPEEDFQGGLLLTATPGSCCVNISS